MFKIFNRANKVQLQHDDTEANGNKRLSSFYMADEVLRNIDMKNSNSQRPQMPMPSKRFNSVQNLSKHSEEYDDSDKKKSGSRHSGITSILMRSFRKAKDKKKNSDCSEITDNSEYSQAIYAPKAKEELVTPQQQRHSHIPQSYNHQMQIQTPVAPKRTQSQRPLSMVRNQQPVEDDAQQEDDDDEDDEIDASAAPVFIGIKMKTDEFVDYPKARANEEKRYNTIDRNQQNKSNNNNNNIASATLSKADSNKLQHQYNSTITSSSITANNSMTNASTKHLSLNANKFFKALETYQTSNNIEIPSNNNMSKQKQEADLQKTTWKRSNQSLNLLEERNEIPKNIQQHIAQSSSAQRDIKSPIPKIPVRSSKAAEPRLIEPSPMMHHRSDNIYASNNNLSSRIINNNKNLSSPSETPSQAPFQRRNSINMSPPTYNGITKHNSQPPPTLRQSNSPQFSNERYQSRQQSQQAPERRTSPIYSQPLIRKETTQTKNTTTSPPSPIYQATSTRHSSPVESNIENSSSHIYSQPISVNKNDASNKTATIKRNKTFTEQLDDMLKHYRSIPLAAKREAGQANRSSEVKVNGINLSRNSEDFSSIMGSNCRLDASPKKEHGMKCVITMNRKMSVDNDTNAPSERPMAPVRNRASIKKDRDFVQKHYSSPKDYSAQEDCISQIDYSSQRDIAQKDYSAQEEYVSRKKDSSQRDIAQKNFISQRDYSAKEDCISQKEYSSQRDYSAQDEYVSLKKKYSSQKDIVQKYHSPQKEYSSQEDYVLQNDCVPQKKYSSQRDIAQKNYSSQKDHIAQEEYISQKDYSSQRDIEQKDYGSQRDNNAQEEYVSQKKYSSQKDIAQKNYSPQKEYSSQEDYISQNDYSSQKDIVQKEYISQRDYSSQRDITQKDNNSLKDYSEHDDYISQKECRSKRDTVQKEYSSQKKYSSLKENSVQENCVSQKKYSSQRDIAQKDLISMKDYSEQDDYISQNNYSLQRDAVQKNIAQKDYSSQKNHKSQKDNSAQEDYILQKESKSKRDSVQKDLYSHKDYSAQEEYVSQKKYSSQKDIVQKNYSPQKDYSTQEDYISQNDYSSQRDIAQKDFISQRDYSSQKNIAQRNYSSQRDLNAQINSDVYTRESFVETMKARRQSVDPQKLNDVIKEIHNFVESKKNEDDIELLIKKNNNEGLLKKRNSKNLNTLSNLNTNLNDNLNASCNNVAESGNGDDNDSEKRDGDDFESLVAVLNKQDDQFKIRFFNCLMPKLWDTNLPLQEYVLFNRLMTSIFGEDYHTLDKSTRNLANRLREQNNAAAAERFDDEYVAAMASKDPGRDFRKFISEYLLMEQANLTNRASIDNDLSSSSSSSRHIGCVDSQQPIGKKSNYSEVSNYATMSNLINTLKRRQQGLYSSLNADSLTPSKYDEEFIYNSKTSKALLEKSEAIYQSVYNSPKTERDMLASESNELLKSSAARLVRSDKFKSSLTLNLSEQDDSENEMKSFNGNGYRTKKNSSDNNRAKNSLSLLIDKQTDIRLNLLKNKLANASMNSYDQNDSDDFKLELAGSNMAIADGNMSKSQLDSNGNGKMVYGSLYSPSSKSKYSLSKTSVPDILIDSTYETFSKSQQQQYQYQQQQQQSQQQQQPSSKRTSPSPYMSSFQPNLNNYLSNPSSRITSPTMNSSRSPAVTRKIYRPTNKNLVEFIDTVL